MERHRLRSGGRRPHCLRQWLTQTGPEPLPGYVEGFRQDACFGGRGHKVGVAKPARQDVQVQVFRAMLENAASEQGSRMTAMDNATRNAGDMIKKQTMQYNRSRQALITKELIEIISGAEAL